MELTLFHGRGGERRTRRRLAGAPRASALPPGTVDGRIKITEQGEIISQQFGLLPVAERSLEVTLSGVLLHGFTDWRTDVAAAEVDALRARIDDAVARGLASRIPRRSCTSSAELFTLFRAATPIAELADARFGSRPAYRPGASAGIDGIRAIPWAFGWTQIRLMLTGWLGVGTALATMRVDAGGLRELQEMARTWPFFDDFLQGGDGVREDRPQIARLYVEPLGGDDGAARVAGGGVPAHRGRRARASAATRADRRRSPVLQAAIALRNPYVDPLSLLQVALMSASARAAPPTRKRASTRCSRRR